MLSWNVRKKYVYNRNIILMGAKPNMAKRESFGIPIDTFIN